MTLFLQYNVNNHIWDSACHLWWPSVLSVSESVCTEQGSTEFRTPLCVILAMPLHLSDPHRLYQLSNHHSQQHINTYHCTYIRIIYFTVILCVYVIVPYLFYIKRLFTNLFSFQFQTKNSDTLAYVYSWLSNDADRNQQNN